MSITPRPLLIDLPLLGFWLSVMSYDLYSVWIGEEDLTFWQDVVFEHVPTYCGSCKHLGHACYVTNPGLHKP